MKMFVKMSLFVIVASLLGCGGGKKESGVSSMNSALTSPYKYFIYVANHSDSTISSFSMNRETGILTPIETTASAGNPISLAVSPSGDKLYVANGSANLQIFSVNKSNGALIPFQNISGISAQSSVTVSPDGRFVYLTSHSGTGKVYSVSTLTGNLFPIQDIVVSAQKNYIHPNGNLIFLMSSTGITFWPINKSTGETLISGGAYTASIVQPHSMILSPDGGKMYTSNNNQGHGLINSYNLDLANRTASSIQTTRSGSSIGGISISNFGKVLIATELTSNKLHSYLINSTTGTLTEADSKDTENFPFLALFFPDGQYALVVNKESKSVSTFLVDENSGTLKSVGVAKVGTNPNDLVIVKVSN